MMRIVFTPEYTVRTPGHVFRADKFEAALKLALREGYFKRSDVVAPELPSRADLELAHTRSWVRKLLSGKFTPADSARAEMTITRAVAEAHLYNVGGTVLAAQFALKDGVGLNCGGGGHHAFAHGGEGFCLVNDIAVAIKKLLKTGKIKKAMVIDLDAHQGNGTAAIFRGDRRVFTFSMHNEAIYPEIKGHSTLDVGLKPGCSGSEYLTILRAKLPRALSAFRPGLVVYLAGADVYREDRLGGLKLSMRDIRARDAFVLAECRRRGLPAAVVLGGGYAKKFSDTVRIHANTLIEAASSGK